MRRPDSVRALLATHALVACFAVPAAAGPSVYPPELIIGQPLRIGSVSYSVAVFGGNPCRDLRIQSLPETLRSDPGAGCGAIVRTDARGSATVVHRFTPSEGAWPFSLRAAADGTLLGVTALGGRYGQGTSFRFDPKTSRLTVLQSLAESASLGFGNAPAGNAFAFDDGSVLAEDDKKGEFLLLADGKSARRLALFRRASLGPFVITPDGRATFLIGAGSPLPSPCGGPVLASLGLDGSLKDLSQQYHRGACPRNGIYLSRLSSITVARDGSLVANDEQYIFVAKPGHDFERVYPAAGHPAYLETDSVTEKFSGDLWFRPGPFDQTQCAIMHLRAGSTPLVAKCSAAQVKAATLPLEAPAKSLFDIEYFTSLAVESDPDTSKITATYRGSAYADTPKIDSDARAVDFELSNVNDPSAAPVRLYPAAARVATVEFDDPDVKHNDFSIAVELPHDRPGLYRLSVRPGSALRAPDGVAVPLATDEERGYVFIASLPAAGADADVDQAKLAYAGHDVTLQTEVTLDCGPNRPELLPGDRLHVVGIARIKGGAATGYGPSGSHEHPPGDSVDAFAPFLSLYPVGVTFADPFDPSETCDPEPFADFSDIRRSLMIGP